MARDRHRDGPARPAQAPAEAKAEKAAAAAGWPAPTRLSLDFRDRTLAEIVDGLNARGPTMLAVGRTPGARLPRERRSPARRPGTPFVEPEPVTFWEAVDRVARATQSWPASGNTPAGKLGILLVPDSPDRGFAANDGAFRVVVTGTHYSSRFQFSPYFYNQPGLEQPRVRRVEPTAGPGRRAADHGRASAEDRPPGRIDRPRGGRRPGPQPDPGCPLARAAEQARRPEASPIRSTSGSPCIPWTTPASGSSGWRGASRSRSLTDRPGSGRRSRPWRWDSSSPTSRCPDGTAPDANDDALVPPSGRIVSGRAARQNEARGVIIHQGPRVVRQGALAAKDDGTGAGDRRRPGIRAFPGVFASRAEGFYGRQEGPMTRGRIAWIVATLLLGLTGCGGSRKPAAGSEYPDFLKPLANATEITLYSIDGVDESTVHPVPKTDEKFYRYPVLGKMTVDAETRDAIVRELIAARGTPIRANGVSGPGMRSARRMAIRLSIM